jgi:glycosyltransferase involved in cell wall biosynthesis
MLGGFDVGLLCSDSEGFSNSLIEYQQAGLPVVCSETGGNPEIIEHGVNGFLYPVGDTDELSAQLVSLARAPELAMNMGRAGRLKVKQCYGLSRLLSEHEALYESLLGNH